MDKQKGSVNFSCVLHNAINCLLVRTLACKEAEIRVNTQTFYSVPQVTDEHCNEHEICTYNLLIFRLVL